jgi:hypothetical protein
MVSSFNEVQPATDKFVQCWTASESGNIIDLVELEVSVLPSLEHPQEDYNFDETWGNDDENYGDGTDGLDYNVFYQ